MKRPLLYAWLLASQCGVVAVQEQGEVINPGGDYDRGYKAGVAEANQRLEEGKATLYIHGLRRPGEFLDRETGLPRSHCWLCRE